MATIVNTPAASEPSSNSGMGFLLGVILLIVFMFLLFYYGLPALRSSASPQINVPGKIDVNVNNPQGGNNNPGQPGQ